MQWRNLTRCLLLRCKLSFAARDVSSFRLQCRYKSSTRSIDQTFPWDTSWLAPESKHESNAGPSKGKGVSPKIPRNVSIDRGVSIDKRGQLNVVSRTVAEKDCRTALILSAASTHLTRADFTRLLPENKSTRPDGIEAAIPGRHVRSLNRLPYWILLFRTPFLAASYQSRLRWYHQNAVENLPVNPLQAALIPGRGLTPPPGFVDPESGEDVWKGLLEYAVLQPTQDFSVTALLPDFPLSVNQAIQRHKMWNHLDGVRSWTVRIRTDGYHLTKDRIFRFLEEDGRARNRSWDIMRRETTNVPDYVQSSNEAPPAIFEETSSLRRSDDLQNFGVKFASEGEAMRFWRTWHRLPFPRPAEDVSTPDCDFPLLHVELAW